MRATPLTQIQDNAGAIRQCSVEARFDVIVRDAARWEYLVCWPALKRMLRPGSLLVVDNAISHAAEVVPFMTMVSADADFTTCTVPVRNGEFLATHAGASELVHNL